MFIAFLGLLAGKYGALSCGVMALVALPRGHPRRGQILSRLALGIACFSVLASSPLWWLAIRGVGSRGEEITWRDDSELYEVLIGEVVALAFTLGVWIYRRRGPDPANPFA